MSRRASIPTRLIIWPPFPSTIPFCPARSTRMVASMEACPSSAYSRLSQRTPTECGSSWRR